VRLLALGADPAAVVLEAVCIVVHVCSCVLAMVLGDRWISFALGMQSVATMCYNCVLCDGLAVLGERVVRVE
jgi:hypothetical protein